MVSKTAKKNAMTATPIQTMVAKPIAWQLRRSGNVSKGLEANRYAVGFPVAMVRSMPVNSAMMDSIQQSALIAKCALGICV